MASPMEPLGRGRLVWQLALRSTTTPWSGGRTLASDEAVALEQAQAAGWAIRLASPRWDAIWSAEAELLAALHTVVMPTCWVRLDAKAWRALLHERMRDLGLPAPLPDPESLVITHRQMWAALAPSWIGTGKPFDLGIGRGR